MPSAPLTNRPPHPNLLPGFPPGIIGEAVRDRGSPRLRHGLMRLHGDAFDPVRPSYGVNFLFNPSEIATSYTTNTDLVGAQYQSPAQLATINRFPGSVGLAFALLFDRSYEMMYHPHNRVGVLEDVAAIERMLEIDKNGLILPVPIQFFFGGENDGRHAAGFYFYGFVQNISVTYTKFSINMVPTRCAVSMSVQQIIVTNPGEALGLGEGGGVTGVDSEDRVLGVASPIVSSFSSPTGNIPTGRPGNNPGSTG